MRQQFIEQLAQKGQGAGMIRSEGGRIAQEGAAFAFVGLLDLGKFLQRRMFEPVTQMPERVLVRHKINAELAATGVQLEDFVAGERSPAAPDWFVVAIGEGVLGVELELIDFEIGEVINQIEQRMEVGNTATRNVKHDAAPREVGIVANGQPWQPASILAH